jgi:hypothetical protein
MVRMDGAEARKERIGHIAKAIQAALFQNKEAGWISLQKTVSKIMIDTGLTKNKVMEYLELLTAAAQFELDEKNDRITRVSVSEGV